LTEWNPFESFFRDPVYLDFKNHLYNYERRREEILRCLLPAARTIVEVGSGISPIVPPGPNVIYSDVSEEAVRQLKVRTCAPVLVSNAAEIALRDECASTVICSEVIEHVKDDLEVLSEMARILQRSGELILTVPAHSYYFSYDDRFVQHWRRYRIPDLVKVLSTIGFQDFHVVKVAGPLEKITMILAVTVVRMASFFRGGKPRSRSALLGLFFPFYKGANKLLSFLVRWEAKIVPLSLATIVLIHCRKTNSTSGHELNKPVAAVSELP
jgi:ubiquinone/menaquinone biosynthesis C-methylase UbiE